MMCLPIDDCDQHGTISLTFVSLCQSICHIVSSSTSFNYLILEETGFILKINTCLRIFSILKLKVLLKDFENMLVLYI